LVEDHHSKDKLNNKKYYTVRTVPKSTRKIAERGKINTPDTQIHDRSLSCLDSSIKSDGVKLVIWAQPKDN